jgi:hypothetical protein
MRAFETANFFMDDTGISEELKDKDLTPSILRAERIFHRKS